MLPAQRDLRKLRTSATARISVVLVTCIVAGLALAACSGGSSASPKAADNASQSGSASHDVLVSAADQSSQSNTVHFKLNVSLGGGATGGQQVTGTGAVDFPNHEAQMDMTALGMNATVVTTANTAYIQSSVLGSGWYSLNSQSAGNGFGQIFGSGLLDPSTQFALIKQSSSNVQKVGTETIDGEQATHYRATVDVAKAAAQEGADAQRLQTLKDMGISQVPVDVWVNNKDQVVQIASSYTGGQNAGPLAGENVQVTVDYFDYGQPANIQTPPASQVQPLSSSSIGQLFGSGSGKESVQ